jgi:hypothetical protein
MLSFDLEGFFELQIGLLVGKLAVVSSVRDLVFALIPTPAINGEEAVKMTPPLPSDTKGSKEGGGSSGKGGGKKGKIAADSSSSLTVDSEWVAEHARQVSRMLVGGMEVVGIFVFATESAFKNSTAIFWQAVRAVATASPIHVDGNEVVERLLLHISSSPKRLSCRSCAVDSGFSSAGLRPCDWKLGKVLSNLHTFVCSHPVEFRYASQQVGPFCGLLLSCSDSVQSFCATEKSNRLISTEGTELFLF